MGDQCYTELRPTTTIPTVNANSVFLKFCGSLTHGGMRVILERQRKGFYVRFKISNFEHTSLSTPPCPVYTATPCPHLPVSTHPLVHTSLQVDFLCMMLMAHDEN